MVMSTSDLTHKIATSTKINFMKKLKVYDAIREPIEKETDDGKETIPTGTINILIHNLTAIYIHQNPLEIYQDYREFAVSIGAGPQFDQLVKLTLSEDSFTRINAAFNLDWFRKQVYAKNWNKPEKTDFTMVTIPATSVDMIHLQKMLQRSIDAFSNTDIYETNIGPVKDLFEDIDGFHIDAIGNDAIWMSSANVEKLNKPQIIDGFMKLFAVNTKHATTVNPNMTKNIHKLVWYNFRFNITTYLELNDLTANELNTIQDLFKEHLKD